MVRVGERVSQGSTIGLVGSTGVSTGAHLHFEFLENGVFKDPLIVAKRGETIPIAAASRPAFEAQAKRMKLELAAAAGTQIVSAN